MNEEEDNLYPFKIVEFIKNNGQGGPADVDCVPCSWISYDTKSNTCISQFMPPPYNNKRTKIIDEMIKSQTPPSTDWPWYPVTLKGRARTYVEAIQKLDILNEKAYAYTTESDDHAAQMAIYDSKAIERKSKVRKGEELETIMNVPKFDNKSDKSESASDKDYELSRTSSDTTSEMQEQDHTRIHQRKRQSHKGNVQTYPKSVGTFKKYAQFKKEDGRRTKRRNSAAPSQTEPEMLNESEITTQKKCSSKVSSKSQGKSPHVEYILPKRADNAKSSEINSLSQCHHNLENYISTQQNVKEKINSTISSNISVPSIESVMKNQANYSQDTIIICSAIVGLKHAIQLLTEHVVNSPINKNVQSCIIADDVINEVKTTFHLEIPVASYEAFQKLEKKLEESDFYKKFLETLKSLLDPDRNLNKSVRAMIKKFFTRTFAMSCTAVKESDVKHVLKPTTFYRGLRKINIENHKNENGGPVSERTFYHALGSVLNNSKDWDNYRQKRNNHRHTANNYVNAL